MGSRIANLGDLPNPALCHNDTACSPMERRKFASCLFDAGVIIPEIKSEDAADTSLEEVITTYQQRNKKSKPLMPADTCDLTDQEFKPLVSFAGAAKFDDEKKLNVAATIGELIKQAFNQTAEPSEQIKGNLRVNFILPYLRAMSADLGIQPLEWFHKPFDNYWSLPVLPLHEKQWFIFRLLDAGACVAEYEQSLAAPQSEPVLFTISASQFYNCDFVLIGMYYKKLVDEIRVVLTKDPSSVVLRYVVGDEFANHLNTPTALAQNPHTLLAVTRKNAVQTQPKTTPLSPKLGA